MGEKRLGMLADKAGGRGLYFLLDSRGDVCGLLSFVVLDCAALEEKTALPRMEIRKNKVNNHN